MNLHFQSLTALDLRFVVREVQFLLGARVNKIYHPNPEELHLVLHIPSKGRVVLTVVLPSLLYLGSQKESTERPSGFAMGLRKRLTQAKISAVEQVGFDRVMKISFDREYTLFIELFGKGNVILVENGKVVATMLRKGGTRLFKHKEEYSLPDSLDPTTLDSFDEIWTEKTEDMPVVKWAATVLGLGGKYAEELCAIAGVDSKSTQLSDSDLKKIHSSFIDLINHKLKPIIVEKKDSFQVLPFELLSQPEKDVKSADSFVGAFASIAESLMSKRKKSELGSAHTSKLDKQKKMIVVQKKRYDALLSGAEKDSKVGEFIYENYAKIKKLLDDINLKREKLSTEDFEEFLKNHADISDYDLKNHRIKLKD